MTKIIKLIRERNDKTVGVSKFLCEEDIVPEKALRTAVRGFLRSDAGKKAIEIASNFFTWEDAINNVPDAIWLENGLSPYGDPVDIIVNEDEILNEDDRSGGTKPFRSYAFNEIVFDDVCIKGEDNLNDWTGLCEPCRLKHNLGDTPGSSIDYDAGSGVCGIQGCSNESDHYIDFKDGVLQGLRYCLTCGVEGINLTERTVGSEVSRQLLEDRQHYLAFDEKVLLCDCCTEVLSS